MKNNKRNHRATEAVQRDSSPGKAKAWIEAMRLRTLPVSVAGVIAAAACSISYGTIRILPWVICLLFAVAAQIVANFANEYFDFKGGRDRKGREGFRRGVTEGDITPQAMKRATYILLGIDCLLGLALTLWGGLWLVIPGILIAIFALAYSAGPFPLSCRGLGDVAVVIFFGLVPVYFTTYLCTGLLDTWAVTMPIGGAVGLLAANVLIVNNYRDADDDRLVGKYTTVVIFGRKVMLWVYLANVIIATFLVGYVIYRQEALMEMHSSLRYIMVDSLCAVGGFNIWMKMRKLKGAALNRILKASSQFLLIVAVFFLLWEIIAMSDILTVQFY